MHLVFPSNLAKPLPLISPRYYSRPKRNKKKKMGMQTFFLGGGGGGKHGALRSQWKWWMAETASGKDEANPAFWFATRAIKMTRSFPFGISLFGQSIINPLLTKLVLSRWLFVALVFYYWIQSTSSWSIKTQKSRLLSSNLEFTLGQYNA